MGALPALLCLGLSALSLSACHIEDGSGDPIAETDYHLQHPIVLTQAPTTVDIFAPTGKLDAQSAASIHAFADRYREFGAGQIAILAPSSRRGSSSVTIAEIRRELYASGVRGNVAVGSYPVAGSATAAPVRLVFQGLTAKVPTRCGKWPEDLASGDNFNEWKNLPYENFGCATQSMLAAQIDDPRDLARARAVTEPDVEMRLRAIDAVRKGNDPGTNWKIQNTAIGTVGGS